mmetsp:Transcript_17979/g.58823  ORF Transcript_17979/g.58823 Transcript_17979/m.58823 type:complete len:401 (-) Transcript_17979:790-1992(-)
MPSPHSEKATGPARPDETVLLGDPRTAGETKRAPVGLAERLAELGLRTARAEPLAASTNQVPGASSAHESGPPDVRPPSPARPPSGALAPQLVQHCSSRDMSISLCTPKPPSGSRAACSTSASESCPTASAPAAPSAQTATGPHSTTSAAQVPMPVWCAASASSSSCAASVLGSKIRIRRQRDASLPSSVSPPMCQHGGSGRSASGVFCWLRGVACSVHGVSSAFWCARTGLGEAIRQGPGAASAGDGEALAAPERGVPAAGERRLSPRARIVHAAKARAHAARRFCASSASVHRCRPSLRASRTRCASSRAASAAASDRERSARSSFSAPSSRSARAAAWPCARVAATISSCSVCTSLTDTRAVASSAPAATPPPRASARACARRADSSNRVRAWTSSR